MYEVIILFEDGRKVPIAVSYEDLKHIDEIINSELDYVVNPVEVPDYEEKYNRLKKEIEDSTNDSIVEVLEGYWDKADELQEEVSSLKEEIKSILFGDDYDD